MCMCAWGQTCVRVRALNCPLTICLRGKCAWSLQPPPPQSWGVRTLPDAQQLCHSVCTFLWSNTSYVTQILHFLGHSQHIIFNMMLYKVTCQYSRDNKLQKCITVLKWSARAIVFLFKCEEETEQEANKEILWTFILVLQQNATKTMQKITINNCNNRRIYFFI